MKENLWIITDRKIDEATAREIIAGGGDWNIDSIENITEQEAQLMAERHEVIKGHNIYFIDFKGAFGYSYVTFKNGHHLRYAADYQLHHSHRSRDQLYKYYKQQLNKKLYTEKGLAAKLKNYHDYKARKNYLLNYYCDMENHISPYGNFNDPEFKAQHEAATKDLYFNYAIWGYYSSPEFVDKCEALDNAIEAAREAMSNDFDYWKKAFRYEFSNYECIYGGRYSEAASNATNGNALNEVQKRAYKEAKREYEKYYYDNDLI